MKSILFFNQALSVISRFTYIMIVVQKILFSVLSRVSFLSLASAARFNVPAFGRSCFVGCGGMVEVVIVGGSGTDVSQQALLVVRRA